MATTNTNLLQVFLIGDMGSPLIHRGETTIQSVLDTESRDEAFAAVETFRLHGIKAGVFRKCRKSMDAPQGLERILTQAQKEELAKIFAKLKP